ncbi:MAG TPA: glycerol kinase GlpK [archaeon]|nr:glycerol kinase GlpK [archaeon]
MERYILAIDQGTTRTKAAVFDERGRLRGFGSVGVNKLCPRPGWVEEDPSELWKSILHATRSAMRKARCGPRQILGVGLDNQGETVVAWNKTTGRPIYNAIVWQCRRTTADCERLKARPGLQREVRRKTGLVIDPYFSASKLRWLIDNAKNAKRLVKSRELLFGTSDAWLVWKMTGSRYLITDPATASRTMIFNIHKMKWDEELLQLFKLPAECLPKIVENSGQLAYTDPGSFLGIQAPISGLIVDQQAALFGHGCFKEGELKNTYGTGCFMLMNIGDSPQLSHHGLLTTVAWVLNGTRRFALDGGVYTAGSAIDWLVNGLGIIRSPSETDRLASSIPNNEGVYFVPAFVGLAAPYWDSSARGTVVGITERATRANIARATLESIAYQVHDVLHCMEADTGLTVRKLRVDGGPTANRFLMQFQADILDVPVEAPEFSEMTTKGTAMLAGMGVDLWDSPSNFVASAGKKIYKPKMRSKERARLISGWRKAVARSRGWNW